MAPNPKVVRAFRAMRDIGIPEEKVKPVLKNLLKLYEKNWELIEEENYRALADAIFDTEELEAEENKKKHESTEVENKKKQENTEREEDLEEQLHDEPERPLKRLRLRHQDGEATPSFSNSSPGLGGTSFTSPKTEGAELLETHTQHQSLDIAPPQAVSENIRTESQLGSPHRLTRNKGKLPVSPKSLALQERSDPFHPVAADRSQPDVTKRTESNPVYSPMRLRDRGKEPLLPQNSSREKRTILDRSSQALRFKEPNVEPGIILLPKQKMPDTSAFIKPKDEPFTDVIPQFEAPIAVIHPEPSHKGDSSIQNGSTEEANGSEPLASQAMYERDKNDGSLASSNETRKNCELANILDESTANLEIAASPLGEVKISLSCDSALGRPGFRVPSPDAVLKAVEDKCLRSYKVLDPNFSVVKLMKDMCECFLELATDSNNESQEIINVTPTINLLKEYCAADAVGSRGTPISPLNESVDIQCDAEVALSQLPRLPTPCNGMDDLVQPYKNSSGPYGEINKEMEHKGLGHTNRRSLVVVQQRQLTPEDIRSLHYVSDIAKGQERVAISLVNEINTEFPPSFHYIPQNVVFQNAYMNFSLARIGDDNCCSTCFGDCLSSSTPCACAHETGGDFAYTIEGLVKEEFLDECVSMNRYPQKHCHFYCKECPLERSKNEVILEPCKGHLMRKFIKECWWKCGCSKQCGNRVVQRGINCNLQVFMTPGGKGWGLRTVEDLPKGAFVCEYVGEVLTNAELYDRVSRSATNEEHAYPVLLDADWGSEGVLNDEEALCLDATYYGNVARFINHRCFAENLVAIPVEVETPDHHYYHLAFFTTRKVGALEELTWDYGIDFDDHDHPVKAFRCKCGSKYCRNIKRSRSRSSARR